MKLAVFSSLFVLAACSPQKPEVSIEVETARETVGPVSATRSVETTVEVTEEEAAKIRESMRRSDN